MIPKSKSQKELERHLFDLIDAVKYIFYILRRDFKKVSFEYFETLKLIPIIISVFFKKYILGTEIKLIDKPKAFVFFWVLLITLISAVWIINTEPIGEGFEKAIETPEAQGEAGYLCQWLGWTIRWSTCGE